MKLLIVILLWGFFTSSFCQSNFFTKDWENIIDTTWGEGHSTIEKLAVFDSVWNMIDQEYACFHNLEIDWNEEKTKYRTEIENGVSR